MTIGSVPPNEHFNCVRNVTFSDITFHHPIKGIYLKTNPGTKGSGIISDITYENIWMHNPIWWAIYIGPQQQEQPDGAGPGCMLYPLTACETQPRVPFKNIKLRNVHSTGGILPSGIIRCNETNPCHGFEFTNVTTSSLMDKLGYGYITENIYGIAENSSPNPDFKAETGVVDWFVRAVKGAIKGIKRD
mmetsp:Transcript_27631/g.5073  ORF Transcript_27631/g.5073 Transcript_27631/m.5073 type:complete len:189 (+) Transcript_27631:859-1425(+)